MDSKHYFYLFDQSINDFIISNSAEDPFHFGADLNTDPGSVLKTISPLLSTNFSAKTR